MNEEYNIPKASKCLSGEENHEHATNVEFEILTVLHFLSPDLTSKQIYSTENKLVLQ